MADEQLKWILAQVDEVLGERERAVAAEEVKGRARARIVDRAEKLTFAVLQDAGNINLAEWYRTELRAIMESEKL